MLVEGWEGRVVVREAEASGEDWGNIAGGLGGWMWWWVEELGIQFQAGCGKVWVVSEEAGWGWGLQKGL